MHTNPETLGDIIKYYRERSEYTVEELANIIGITERYLYRIENEGKKPSFKILERFIKILSIPPSKIFFPKSNCSNERIIIIAQMLSSFDEKKLIIIESFINCLIEAEQ